MTARWNVWGPAYGHHWKSLTLCIFLSSIRFGHLLSAASLKSVVSQEVLPRPEDFKFTLRTPPEDGRDIPFAGETTTWEAFIKKNDVRDTAGFADFVSTYMSPPLKPPASESKFYTAELQVLKLQFLNVHHPYVRERKTWKLPLLLMVEDETKEHGRPQRALKYFLENLFGSQVESRSNFLEWLQKHSANNGKEMDMYIFYDLQRLYEQYAEWYYHLSHGNQHMISEKTDHMEHYDLVCVKRIGKEQFVKYLMQQEYYPISYISRNNPEPKVTLPLFQRTWSKYLGIPQNKVDEFILWLKRKQEGFSTIDDTDFYKKKDLVQNYVKWVHENPEGWYYIPYIVRHYGLRWTIEHLDQTYRPRDITFEIMAKSIIRDPVERMYFKWFVKKSSHEQKGGLSRYTEDYEISKEDIHQLHNEWNNSKKPYLYRFYELLKRAIFRIFPKKNS